MNSIRVLPARKHPQGYACDLIHEYGTDSEIKLATVYGASPEEATMRAMTAGRAFEHTLHLFWREKSQ